MNVRIAKEELALQLPASMSHYFRDEEPMVLPVAAPRAGVLARLQQAARWVADLPRRRAVLDELSTLSDHELADIGLSRSELTRVFEPGFAAARAAADRSGAKGMSRGVVRA